MKFYTEEGNWDIVGNNTPVFFFRDPLRFPDLNIVISEGGVGWVAGLIDRLDHMEGYRDMYGTWERSWIRPADVLRRNFYFCALEDPTGMAVRSLAEVAVVLCVISIIVNGFARVLIYYEGLSSRIV